MVQSLVVGDREFVIIDREEYERLLAGQADSLPALPAANAEGLTPALEYGRAVLARKLVIRRKEAGLSQAELARKARIRAETLNRIERGRVNPDQKTLRKIVNALDRLQTPRTANRHSAP